MPSSNDLLRTSIPVDTTEALADAMALATAFSMSSDLAAATALEMLLVACFGSRQLLLTFKSFHRLHSIDHCHKENSDINDGSMPGQAYNWVTCAIAVEMACATAVLVAAAEALASAAPRPFPANCMGHW